MNHRTIAENASHLFTGWRKSSRSSGGGNCVEVSVNHDIGLVAVRDTKDPAGPALIFELDEWGAALACVRQGTFRLPPCVAAV
ncbi:DUF397 domain-containing protein [Longispora sp. K20-0274]|uniref:DUF397 domain-containing protein n=1 Tax=Longispora sp. K20-0274 TaxID=3088255 RepID=UPI003999919D